MAIIVKRVVNDTQGMLTGLGTIIILEPFDPFSSSPFFVQKHKILFDPFLIATSIRVSIRDILISSF